MRIKAKHIIDAVKKLKGNKNINPINRITEERDLPHISTASAEIQARHDKLMDRGDHPEQAARRLGFTTLEKPSKKPTK